MLKFMYLRYENLVHRKYVKSTIHASEDEFTICSIYVYKIKSNQ